MNIPSNFTLQEALAYLPASPALSMLQSKLQPFINQLQQAEEALTQEIKENEVMVEQSHFREDLLNEILELCEDTSGTKKEMIRKIKLKYEESQVEL